MVTNEGPSVIAPKYYIKHDFLKLIFSKQESIRVVIWHEGWCFDK